MTDIISHVHAQTFSLHHLTPFVSMSSAPLFPSFWARLLCGRDGGIHGREAQGGGCACSEWLHRHPSTSPRRGPLTLPLFLSRCVLLLPSNKITKSAGLGSCMFFVATMTVCHPTCSLPFPSLPPCPSPLPSIPPIHLLRRILPRLGPSSRRTLMLRLRPRRAHSRPQQSLQLRSNLLRPRLKKHRKQHHPHHERGCLLRPRPSLTFPQRVSARAVAGSAVCQPGNSSICYPSQYLILHVRVHVATTKITAQCLVQQPRPRAVVRR